MSESSIKVMIDGSEVETLPPFSEGWRHRQIIVRDVLAGETRRLVFDNIDYPRTGKDRKRRFKRWAVRRVRATPLVREVEDSFERKLSQAFGLSKTFDKTPDGLFIFIRALQLSLLELLIETKIDSAPVAPTIYDGTSDGTLDPEELGDVIASIRTERMGETSASINQLHQEALVRLIGKLDGELWRRVESRFRQARYSARAKNSIVVYDHLIATKAMFPDETDYRWVIADRMLEDKRYVPKKVRENPGKYRK